LPNNETFPGLVRGRSVGARFTGGAVRPLDGEGPKARLVRIDAANNGRTCSDGGPRAGARRLVHGSRTSKTGEDDLGGGGRRPALPRVAPPARRQLRTLSHAGPGEQWGAMFARPQGGASDFGGARAGTIGPEWLLGRGTLGRHSHYQPAIGRYALNPACVGASKWPLNGGHPIMGFILQPWPSPGQQIP